MHGNESQPQRPAGHTPLTGVVQGISYLALTPVFLPSGRRWLDPQELTELRAIPTASRRQEWLTARLALKWLACQRLGGHLRGYGVGHARGGRPLLRISGRAVRWPGVSLSYRGGWGLAAMAAGPLGVDLEIAAHDNHRIRSVVGVPAEYLCLTTALAQPRSGDLETVLLSAKEATLKCAGLAIRLPREQVRLVAAQRTTPTPAPDTGVALAGTAALQPLLVCELIVNGCTRAMRVDVLWQGNRIFSFCRRQGKTLHPG